MAKKTKKSAKSKGNSKSKDVVETVKKRGRPLKSEKSDDISEKNVETKENKSKKVEKMIEKEPETEKVINSDNVKEVIVEKAVEKNDIVSDTPKTEEYIEKTSDKPAQLVSESEDVSEKEEKVIETITESQPEPEKKVEEKKVEPEPVVPIVEKPFDIYDHEVAKEVLEIPVTQVETETQRIISRYKLDYKRLPIDIVVKINDYLMDFRAFLANQSDVSKIPVIMQKDKIAYDAINAWIEPKRKYFEDLTFRQGGGIVVTDNVNVNTPSSKIVVDKNNSQDIINNAPNANPENNVGLSIHPQAGQNPANNNHEVNQFNPRTNTSEYVHTINQGGLTNNPNQINLPPAFGDNSRELSRIMSEMNSNPSNNSVPLNMPINPQSDFLEKYAETIYSLIMNSFQHNLWGYIPLSVLKAILANTEKSLSYDVKMNDTQSYIVISNSQRSVETGKFSCKHG
jgi:hypothetical protein